MLPHAWLHFFLLPSLPSYLSLSLFSVLSRQHEFKQASGQLLNPGGSECSPSWEGPESNSRGFVYPRTLGGRPRLEDTVIAVAWNYTSFGLRIFLCDLYLYPGILYQECWNYIILFFFCSLKTEFPWWGGRGLGLFILVQTEIGSLHGMLGLEPLGQETRTPLWEDGTHGGHGSQAGVSLLLVPSCQL